MVVGSDGSWESHAAVRAATRLAALHGEALVVLAVARLTDTSLTGHRTAQDAARGRGVATATRAVELAHETDSTVPVEAVVLTDLEDPVLHSVAARATRLVVGGHGAGGHSAFSLGTVSEALMRQIPRPILVTATSRGSRKLRTSSGAAPPTARARCRRRIGRTRRRTARADGTSGSSPCSTERLLAGGMLTGSIQENPSYLEVWCRNRSTASCAVC